MPEPAASVTQLGASRSRTRGAEIARLLENEIISAGWRVGDGLGSESALMERFGVGRSVMREAVRILESRHVARPRPGPGGGLVVTAPERSAVLDHASLYLEYAGFSPVDLLEVLEVLEIAAVTQLAGSIGPHGIDDLRAVVAEETTVDDLRSLERSLESEIARLSGNPVLELFVCIGINLGRTHGRQPDAREQRWLHERHLELIDAIEAGDALTATRTVRRLNRALARRHAVQSGRSPVGDHATPDQEGSP
ncbi:MAG: putative GntR family transcriptional regulator [Aeromicrobium sp.]|nr:putative GntR family transcriptional regulator [Aeromicrobium sp.]